jgi:pyruvate dehydrogenase E2 component (dihydrolipoamide acetyltransferase)
MTDILMPALSPTMEEGTLAKWLVKPGDNISSGQIIAEIETDKATMEVEAVDEGVVDALLVEAGTEGVKVNAVIARLKGEGESSHVAAPVATADPPPQGEGDRPQGGGGGERLVGGGEAPSTPPAARSFVAPGSSPLNGGGSVETGESRAAPAPPDQGERIPASPLARRLAQAAGLDLKSIAGSGPHGRVIKRDVDAAIGKAPQQPAAPTGQTPTAPEPSLVAASPAKTLEQLGVPAGSYDLLPLDNIRRTVARRLTEAARDVPHFPLTVDLEIDRLLEARTRINALLEKDGVKVSVNDIVIRCAAAALIRVPEANASYTPEGIAFHHHADIAMAVAIDIDGRPGGLITPIIWQAETKGLATIARETKDLAAAPATAS